MAQRLVSLRKSVRGRPASGAAEAAAPRTAPCGWLLLAPHSVAASCRARGAAGSAAPLPRPGGLRGPRQSPMEPGDLTLAKPHGLREAGMGWKCVRTWLEA